MNRVRIIFDTRPGRGCAFAGDGGAWNRDCGNRAFRDVDGHEAQGINQPTASTHVAQQEWLMAQPEAQAIGPIVEGVVERLGHLCGLRLGIGDDAEPYGLSALQSLSRLFSGSPQSGAMAGTSSIGTTRTDEPDLAGEQNSIGFAPSVLEPWSGSAIGRQGDAIAVSKELVEPRDQRIAATERRVHPDEAVPITIQTVVVVPDAARRYRVQLGRVSNIEIEAAPKRVKHRRWRIPFIRLADAKSMHSSHVLPPFCAGDEALKHRVRMRAEDATAGFAAGHLVEMADAEIDCQAIGQSARETAYTLLTKLEVGHAGILWRRGLALLSSMASRASTNRMSGFSAVSLRETDACVIPII